ncbi:MAG: thiol reductant ABC exporter subunit CydC [Actinobacteria bacterium 13_2_20CM_2_71_6]|nr:MAG: thiol reductant ABC exporter subunit CydC [Actinobacteria bacterium 13_2_20CM_2_71_6]
MRRLLLAAALAAGTDLAGVALVGTATWLIARAAQQPPLVALTVAIVLVRALAIAKGTLRYAERLAGHDAALDLLARLRTRVYAGLSARSGSAPRGDLLARLVSDVDGVQDLLLRCAIPAGVAVVVGLAATGFVASYSVAAGIALALGLSVAGVVLPGIGYALATRAGSRLAAARGAYLATSVDVLAGAADLAAFGATAAAQARADEDAREVAWLERSAGRSGALVGALAGAVPGCAAVAVCLLTLHSGQTVLAAVLPLVALASVETAVPLGTAAARYAALRGGWRRVRELLREPGPDERPAAHEGPVELRDVTVRYAADRVPALDGISLVLPPGRRVAVVGPSGSGKSTLLAVLAGTVAPQGGTVSASGPYVATGVLADAHVFHATIRENVTLGRDAGDVARALTIAGLPGWVDRLDDVVGEDGGRLSGGERQRLLLARALLDPAPVLLLDEPTEGLDPVAADRVLGDVLEAVAGRTIVLVTHRAADLRGFDDVLMLVDGRFVEGGARWAAGTEDVRR